MTVSTALQTASNPVIAYWEQIENGHVIVGQKVRKVYSNLADEIRSPVGRWVYDDDRANHAIIFIEKYCKHSKGRWGGKPLVLEDWQRAFIAAAFGFVDAETGIRRYRELLLIVARKNGKSTLAAAIALYLMMADGEPGAEIYCTATKRDQAKVIWLEAKRMVRKSPALLRRIKTLVAELVGVGDYDGCVMKPLGADSDTQDGLNVHGSTMDEIHAWQGLDLYNVIIDGMSSRDQPLNVIVTTAGFLLNGLYSEVYADAANSINGINVNDRQLAVIYELDEKSEIHDEAMWAKANPGLGTIKDRENLRDKYIKAKRNPRFMPNLLCKDFNIQSITDEAWLTFDELENESTFDPAILQDCYAIGGCDLSATTDLSCATLLVRRRNDPIVYVLQQYFLPEARIEQLEDGGKAREAPYRTWAERGLLTICPGNTVNFHMVTEWFVKMFTEFKIRPLWVCYDRALAGYWAEEMVQYFEMERIPQGAYTWSQPMKEMGAALSAKLVNYNNNPILKWCLSNTRAKSKNADGIESIEPKKISEKLRIDGTVSLLNAWVGYVRHMDEFQEYVRRT